MKIPIPQNAIKATLLAFTLARLFFPAAIGAQTTDPRTNCWFTTYSGQYGRVYTNTTVELAGQAATIWANTNNAQTLPSYCGVQEVYSSSNWIYVRSTGLASYTMGPWYLDSAKMTIFPNLPTNQQVIYRFPRTNSAPATKSENGGGQIGIFVDGVAMFNSWDAYTYDTTNSMDVQNIIGYWNRDAYVNEGVSFDPGYAHQQNTGVYHYHADPIGLRYLLGDHVDYSTTAKTYSEDTNTPTKHSPILAWVADGVPLYGPYGYSNATNANSGIRRMVSGYVIRNGSYGTSNLTSYGRITIPAWAARLYNVSSNESGPSVSSNFPLGRYMEDNDYLGDHINPNTGTNYQQGVDFDLDQYNGRWCVTPDFPNGVYAYFVAINSNGTPVFPYNIGRGYYGNPTGGAVGAITENVATNFLGNTNSISKLNAPVVKTGTVTLTWSALEGGSYTVQSTTNLASPSWGAIASGVSPNETIGGYTNTTPLNKNFYRVGRTSVATFEGSGTTIITTNTSTVPGGSVNPGESVILTITLPTTPPDPPLSAPVTPGIILTNTSAQTQIGCIYLSRPVTNIVMAAVSIPSNAAAGAQNIIVNFGMPTYTLTGELTIN
jgi:YHYH protein